ncbi:EAL domain-containing protein [Pontibacter sp. JAM-7]|uniref:EAL domain-containing protein n=1 Tax=Pontibacter sp. JAM-7 TaxID=3366581 RepID=UPI003AF5D8A9
MSQTRSKVLMVDDNPTNLRMLGRALANEFDLYIANSGLKGLLLAAEMEPDIILLDIMMPELDGYEVCRRLKADDSLKHIPVVFVTALSDIQEEAKGLELGAVDYLTKPVNVNIARSRIHNLVQMERLRKDVASSEAQFRSFFEQNNSVMLLLDPDTGQVVASNHSAQLFYGYDTERMTGLSLIGLTVFTKDSEQAALLAMLSEQRRSTVQQRLHDGAVRDVELYTTPVEMQGRTLIFTIVHDITEKQQAAAKLKLAASVFDHAREGIMIFDAAGVILDVNDAFTYITGYRHDEAVGQSSRLLRSGEHGKEFYEQLWQTLLQDGHWSGEIWNRRSNGEIYAELRTISAIHNAQGEVDNYVSLFTDITQLKKQQQQLEHIAHYDALTGLPNRVLLNDRLRHAMIQDARRGEHVAVLFLDLDGFKEVNDTYGHKVGDLLLMSLAYRMKNVLRDSDTIARLGGDEFVAVMMDLPEPDSCLPLLQRLLNAVSENINIGGNTLQVSASIGVTFYPQAEEVDADQLLRQADQAMYQAELSGKNRYCLFDAEQDRHLRGRHRNIERIRQGIAAAEFQLYYQPKVNMRTGEVIGVEALLRWQHPELGILSPDSFLPDIEDHLAIIELGEWTLKQALQQVRTWQSQQLNLPVSVNIAAYHLQQSNFVEQLRTLMAEFSDVCPAMLELEVLETSALENISHASQVIRDCRRLGILVSLDDFGTGYSSLSYLKLLPAEILKIDRSFVRDMLDDPEDLAILEGVMGLSRAFRRQVIAEGVETAEQGEMLLWLGCEQAQGFGIARPMPAEHIIAWTKSWQPESNWLGQKSLDRQLMPALFGLVEYRSWLQAIDKYLCSDQDILPPLDPLHDWQQHVLGHEDALAVMPAAVLPAFEQLSRRAAGLLKRKAESGVPLPDDELASLRSGRDLVLERIRNWVTD